MRDPAIDRLIETLLEALNARDPQRIAALYAPEFRGDDVGQPNAEHGREAVARTYGRFLKAFPDAVFSGASVVEGGRVAFVWTMRGTHQGTFLRIPPTGREVVLRGVSLLTVADGLFASGTRIWDVAAFLRQARLLPELSE
jgi:steroid delta-isomerase-like uncharacterized protein